ncbi:hypothetical protein [Flavihumibacter sp. ZG627]|uniref:hypothetical protein n=1 Tax=Flavihumibacter sp. ZG627 TaxID=1463156 RepID=UPI00057D5A95|nr:hypothetical protein [Flavihumibacter sp. ZG627]KIC91272.1 hypothetical protein HY58_09770 [Flavihumibacter sp. ZG627]
MSKDEIKSEINKVLDHLSDKALSDLLTFLQNLERKQSISLLDKSTLQKILTEDEDLLHKLAR